MTVETRPLSALRPYPGNPRIIPDAAVAQVAESIRRYGFRQPIVVDAEGVIIAGHTRWLAAQRLGLVEAPVHVASDLTPDQTRALRLADNRVGEASRWAPEALLTEVRALEGAALEGVGLTPEFLAPLEAAYDLLPPERDSRDAGGHNNLRVLDRDRPTNFLMIGVRRIDLSEAQVAWLGDDPAATLDDAMARR